VLKAKMAQSNPEPPTPLSFSFLLSFTCSAAHVALKPYLPSQRCPELLLEQM
jgi:hypothetical protein